GDGGQTMVPPSVHPCGESLTWEHFSTPAEVPLADLQRDVATLAACCLIARHWPAEGSRDRAAMALHGALARAGCDPAEAERFVEAVALAAGDDEPLMRAGKAERTRQKVDDGDKVTGWTRLAELLGERGQGVVRRVRQWLGIDPENREEHGAAQPWPDPIPLGEAPDVLPFPGDVLPGPLG